MSLSTSARTLLSDGLFGNGLALDLYLLDIFAYLALQFANVSYMKGATAAFSLHYIT
jgi:hypothetical protein